MLTHTIQEKQSLAQMHPKHVEVPFLILLSAGMLLLGLSLPVLTIKQMLWVQNTFSVLSGIEQLWGEQHFGLAGLLFFFSIVFPFVKLGALAWIWFAKLRSAQRASLLYWLKLLGKWSMLDVFVVAITIVAVKVGFLVSALPRVGVYVFGTSILLSMGVMMLVDYLTTRAQKN